MSLQEDTSTRLNRGQLVTKLPSMTTDPQESRSFGAGAAGDLTSSAQAAPPTRGERLRYRFDNSLFRSPASFLWWLALGAGATTGIASLVWVGVQPREDRSAVQGFFDQFFDSFNVIFFGNGPSMATWTDRAFSLVCWVISTALMATIIAVISNLISERMEELKKGKSRILESNHTLILGWSSRIFPILQQLSVANENLKDPLIVIFAEMDRELMDSEISSRVGDMGKTRIVTRTGDPSNPRDLERAAVSTARSIIILDDDDSGDAAIVSTVLSIRACAPDSRVTIVAEIDELDHAAALSHATDGQLKAVQSQDVIARVTAQASRQPGLAAVVLDLLDFEGDEIYFTDASELVGKTYGDALVAFDNASVIGIFGNAGVALNPAPSTVFEAGDKVIAVAQDDDKVIFTGLRDDLAEVKAARMVGEVAPSPEHIMVIGWSEMGQAVLTELAQFLVAGSSIHIVANPELVDTSKLSGLAFGKIKAAFTPHIGGIEDLTTVASKRKYDEIIVLGYRGSVSVREADAHTMLTMLLLNKLFAEEGNGVDPTRLVAEILDSRRSELARVASADDLVVSDNLAALMIAQISENPELAPVFADLFDADGSSVNVKPVETYASLGSTVTFGELVAAARSRGESAIGYRIAGIAKSDAASGVRMNPTKTSQFTLEAGDGLVVIGLAHS